MSDYTLTIGTHDVTLSRSRGLHVITATILGVETNGADQVQTIYLDRRLHDSGTSINGWKASGAATTVLTRQ